MEGVPEAHIKNENEMHSFITMPDYKYKMGHRDISATGKGDSRCSWRLKNPELQEQGSAIFVVVFQAPKGMESIELTGLAAAEPKMDWLTANVSDILWASLAKPQSKLLSKRDSERTGKERLSIGAHEKWVLPLSKPTA